MDTGRFLVQPGAAVDLAGFDTRESLDMDFPKTEEGLDDLVVE